ncbi:hypothetical protein ACHAXT_005393 [Thalassiosira profunda]
MRRLALLVAALVMGDCLAAEGHTALPYQYSPTPSEIAPRGWKPLPFLRGGSTAAAVATQTMKKQQTQTRRRRRGKGKGPNPLRLAGIIGQGLGKVGGKMQQDVANIGKHIGREWGKLASHAQQFVAHIPKLLPPRRKKLKHSKLDEVCHTFSSVLRGGEVDTAQLLKACKAHLKLMKTGGSALRIVAKDLESNVQKAERVYKKKPREARHLSSLLECEKSSGIHNGNVLHEKSAAMGLLWIRRSLAFQLDLYASLIHGRVHPKEAAHSAYTRHLSPFHGWALRKIFPASLANMPAREVFMAKFGGIDVHELNDEYDRMIAKKLKALVATWDPLLGTWAEEYERQGLEDTRRV